MQIQIVVADLTALNVDAIVNAANNSLLGGGGVDGAIHRAAGPRLREACIPLRGCATGQAKITPGFDLPAKWVIHTVGPIWRGGQHGEAELLSACYWSSLDLALAAGCQSVAFPAISTGAYGYPKAAAAQIASAAVKSWFANANDAQLVVQFCIRGAEEALDIEMALAQTPVGSSHPR